MSSFRIGVHIIPRRGLLDPQGKAVADALKTLGFPGVGDVHVGRYLIVELSAETKAQAEGTVRSMCEKLLANPVTEDFQIAAVESA